MITCLKIAGALAMQGTGFAANFTTGDIFASIGEGRVAWYRPDGTLVQILNNGLGGVTGGSSFDSAGNLFVTDTGVSSVSRFDTNGNLLGTFGSGYNANPESIVFNGAGDAFVGQLNVTRQILEFDAGGNLLQSFSPAVQNQGTNWLDISSDQHTLYYTSAGNTIKRFDTATNSQLADFATGLPGEAYALRILADGSVLVADSQSVLHLDSAGHVIQTYTPATAGALIALNLDPDGASFWTGDNYTGKLYKVNISSGSIEETITTGSGDLLGVSVFAGTTVAATPEPGQLALALLLCALLSVACRWRNPSNE